MGKRGRGSVRRRNDFFVAKGQSTRSGLRRNATLSCPLPY